MCGIFGFLGLGLPPAEARALLAAMAGRLRHRGPDEEAVWTAPEADLYLGVCRLAITDPLHGQQPFCTPDGRLVCLLNGQLYNHGELRRRLLAYGAPLRTRCDGEVLPYLFAERGAAAWDELDGMYAVAAWDGAARRLSLAVDPQGEKPLYLAGTPGGGWLFASELKALLCAPLPLVPDLQALRRYLSDKAVLHPATGLQGIVKLCPGERVELAAGAPARRTFPDPWPEPSTMPGAPAAPTPAAPSPAALKAALRRAVQTTLPEEQPVGVLLSGGLDSSLILAAAAERLGPGLPAFAIGYLGCPPEADERPHARVAARHAGAELYEVEIAPETVPALLRQVAWHLDEPNQDPITVPTLAVLGEARRRVRVVLTGDAGDELFGGYHRLLPLAPDAPPGGEAAYLAGLWLRPPAEVDRRLLPELSAAAPPDPASPLAQPLAGPGTPLARALRHERRRRLPGYHLSRLDRLSMAWGLEARVPFLRREVRTLAAGLADGDLVAGGVEKTLLRRAAAGWVAPATLARRKQPFTFPLAVWLSGPLSPWAHERLRAPGAFVGTLVRPAALSADLAALRAGDPAAASWIWALLALEEWADAFLLRRGAP